MFLKKTLNLILSLQRILKDERESTSSQGHYGERESIYDEIPLFKDESPNSAEEETESSDDSESIPPPVEKDHPRSVDVDYQTPLQTPVERPEDDAVSALNARMTLHESESDFNYDSFTDDSEDE